MAPACAGEAGGQAGAQAGAILIFEPEADGHQMDFVAYLLEGLAAMRPRRKVILLTTAWGAEHPNFARVMATFGDLVESRVVPHTTRRNQVLQRFAKFTERQRMHAAEFALGLSDIGAGQVAAVLVPNMETFGLVQLCLRPGLFGGRPWATIAVAIRFHHARAGIAGPRRWQDRLQAALFRLVLLAPGLVCFGSVNPYLVGAVRSRKVAWCPEPVPAASVTDPAAARRFYGIRPETCVILVFGYIDRRKCLEVLLPAVAALDPALDVTVVLAGSQNRPQVAAALEGAAADALRARGRLLEFDRYIMAGRDVDPLNAADITWVFYDRGFVLTGSVLARSAVAGRAVVARAQGVIGRIVADSGCGVALDSEAPAAVAEALATLVGDAGLRARMGEAGRAWFAGHTAADFGRPVLAALGRAMPEAFLQPGA